MSATCGWIGIRGCCNVCSPCGFGKGDWFWRARKQEYGWNFFVENNEHNLITFKAKITTTKKYNQYIKTLTCDDDWHLEETSQHLTSWDTTEYNLPNSAYWYLMGGPGPSSKATNMNVAGTFNFNSCCFWKKNVQDLRDNFNMTWQFNNIKF